MASCESNFQFLDNDSILTLGEAAKILRVSHKRLWYAIDSGALPSVRITGKNGKGKGHHKILRSDLARFIASSRHVSSREAS